MRVTSSPPDEIKIPRHIEIMCISPTIISTCMYTTLEKMQHLLMIDEHNYM